MTMAVFHTLSPPNPLLYKPKPSLGPGHSPPHWVRHITSFSFKALLTEARKKKGTNATRTAQAQSQHKTRLNLKTRRSQNKRSFARGSSSSCCTSALHLAPEEELLPAQEETMFLRMENSAVDEKRQNKRWKQHRTDIQRKR